MDLDTLLEWLQADDRFAGQISHVRHYPARDAKLDQPRMPMHPRLVEKLDALGLNRMYSHQAHAYDAAMQGEDLVVVTGTNSGKTLCYNLPAMQMCLSEPAVRALYLFPTKALAQDQLGRLDQLLPGHDIRAGTYDGDTPTSRRGSLRKSAHIILSNPDMLHMGILPSHELWAKFLKSLRLIVLDEIHVYRGVFGSHVGNVLRRLLRLCEWHRSRPQIIACSATIGNPEELFQKLTGREARLIAEDGAPKAKRTFLFWNPPLLDDATRASANLTTSNLLTSFSEGHFRTLAFSRARVSAELVLRYAREAASRSDTVDPKHIESYRAGYTPKERRQIEKALFKGDLLGLSATNAMELGVDIGGLDIVLMNGYPGTISSFWQQAGRAGRGSRDGMAIMVAHDDPLEQFLIREPNLVLAADNERVALNPENPQILEQQIRCAAFERPLAPSELPAFGERGIDIAEELDRAGELEFRAGRFYYPSHEPPAPKVSIRGGGGEQIRLYLDGVELGSMEYWRALQSAHEGAVYLHRGVSYVVEELDLDRGQAQLTQRNVDYYTQAMVQSVIESQPAFKTQKLGGMKAGLCGITVTDLVTGYKVKSLDGDSVLGVHDLQLPPTTYDTIAIQFDLPAAEAAEAELQIAGVHGVEHALMSLAPLLAGTDRGDLGSAWYAIYPSTFAPAIFVFDRTPGGVGLCEKLFDSLSGWMQGSLQLLRSCPCEGGCPACLLSPRCEANNEMLSKREAINLLGHARR